MKQAEKRQSHVHKLLRTSQPMTKMQARSSLWKEGPWPTEGIASHATTVVSSSYDMQFQVKSSTQPLPLGERTQGSGALIQYRSSGRQSFVDPTSGSSRTLFGPMPPDATR